MYQTFYGFQRKPFSLLPDHRLLFLNKRYQLALSLLEFGVMNQNGMILLTGDPGTGKTTLIQRILSDVEETVVVGLLPFTAMRGSSLLPWVAKALALPCPSQLPADMYQSLGSFFSQTAAQGKRVLLVVDEAQNLDGDQLEELRLLFNLNSGEHSVLQLLLAGHSQLREQLQQPDLAAFVQRIGTDFCLEAFNQQDTRAYILHRVHAAGGSASLFSDKACDLVYRYTRGNPRLINQLCETSLIYGFSDQARSITEHYVAEAARDRMKGGLLPLSQDDYPHKLSEEKGEPGSPIAEPHVLPPGVEHVPPKIAAICPDPQRYLDKGMKLQQEGWFLEAIQSLKHAAASSAYHREGWYQIGQCYQMLGRNKEALEAYQAALTSSGITDKDRVPLYSAIGQVLENMGEHEEAQRYDQLARLPHSDSDVGPRAVDTTHRENGALRPAMQQEPKDEHKPFWVLQFFQRLWNM